MKSSLSLIVGGVVAAAAGWWLPETWRSTAPDTPTTPPAITSGPTTPAAGFAWQGSLSQQQAMPNSSSERSWVLWADQIPVNEIESAIRALDLSYDIIPLRLLFSRWAKLDGAAALACFKTIHFPAEMRFVMETGAMMEYPSRLVLDDLLRAWATTDPRAAAAYAKEILQEHKKGYHNISFAAEDLAKWKPAAEAAAEPPMDFIAAAAALHEQPSIKQQASAARNLLAKWTAVDATAALQWWSTVAPEVKQQFGTDWMEWPLSKAPAALAVPAMVEHALRGSASLSTAIQAMSKLGMNDFVANHHDQMGTDRVLQWTSYRLREWLAESPEMAVAWVEQQANPQLKSYLVGQVADQWTQQGKSTQAIQLVQTLPDADLPVALRGLIQGWASSDAKAATQWLQKIQDPICRDECLATVVKQSGKSDPQWALELALTITDPALSKSAISDINRTAADPKALRTMIETISQGDATKHALLSQGIVN